MADSSGPEEDYAVIFSPGGSGSSNPPGLIILAATVLLLAHRRGAQGPSVGPSPGVPSEEPVGLAGGLLDPEPPGEKMTA